MADPLKRALRQMRRDGIRRAQSRDRDTSEQGSADAHLAGDALRALRPGWRNWPGDGGIDMTCSDDPRP